MAKKSRHDINVAEAARKNGLPPHVVHNRLNRGWSLDDALGKPVRLKKSPKKKAAVKKKASTTKPTLRQATEATSDSDSIVAGYITLAVVVILTAVAVYAAG
jgi:hypothetical protein